MTEPSTRGPEGRYRGISSFSYALLFWLLFTFTGYENDTEFLETDTNVFREHKATLATIGFITLIALVTGLVICTAKQSPQSD